MTTTAAPLLLPSVGTGFKPVLPPRPDGIAGAKDIPAGATGWSPPPALANSRQPRPNPCETRPC